MKTESLTGIGSLLVNYQICAVSKASLGINLEQNIHSILTTPKGRLKEGNLTSTSNLKLNTSKIVLEYYPFIFPPSLPYS